MSRKEQKQQKYQKRRMVILSFDATGARDLPALMELPNFRRLAESGALCDQVESVYPSVTYPAHASIITGKMPLHHGIVNNTKLQPQYAKADWLSDRKYIKGTTLYDEAIRRGDRVCALLWPSTGKSRIRYNLPEIHANRPWQNLILKTLADGSFGYTVSALPYALRELKGSREPYLDNYLEKLAVRTIMKHNPELMLVHFLDVDSHRHSLGVDHPEIARAFKRLDARVGHILDALSKTKAGYCRSMEDTTVVILGDHCQMDCHTAVYPNHLLKKHGLLNVDSKGRITDYRVVAKNCDGACYLYLNRKLDKDVEYRKKMTQRLTKMFTDLSDGENRIISHIFTSEEAAQMGADDRCVIMLEAKKGYYFENEHEVLTCPVGGENGPKTNATHGYLPDLPDYKTFLLMSGYGVKKGVRTGPMKLWDEAPTFAKIMGLSLTDTDGSVKTEMLL